MRNRKVLVLFLVAVMTATLFEGCFKKGDEDPFISLRSRKARITQDWEVSGFEGKYLVKLNSGENRFIDLKQTGNEISETTEYTKMSQTTQDSLSAGQDTTIVWKGKINDAYYKIKNDGSFEFVYEYTLEKTHRKEYLENGYNQPISTFWPAFPGQNFSVDSVMKRNYRTVYKGRWNFLHNEDGYKNKERIIFEIEDAVNITNLSTTYIFDAEDDDGVFPNNPVDTTFSRQSLESVSNKYANGERSILWEINKLRSKEVTFKRMLDHIYTHALTGTEGYKETKRGSESIELIPLEDK